MRVSIPWSGVLFPACYREDYFVVLNCYCDESEMTEGGKKLLTVGAVFSAQLAWEMFEEAWKSTLKEHRVEVFHMTDFEGFHPPYDDRAYWNKARRIAFIRSLIAAFGGMKPACTGVAVSVVLDDYLRVLDPRERKLLTPYDLCAQWSINSIGAILGKARVKFPVAYVFEEHHRQGRLIEAFEDAGGTSTDPRRTPRRVSREEARVRVEMAKEKRISTITIARKPAFTPLQAADLWAFEANKNALRHIGASTLPERRSLTALREHIGFECFLWDGPKLRGLYDDLESGRAYTQEGKDRRPRRLRPKKGPP